MKLCCARAGRIELPSAVWRPLPRPVGFAHLGRPDMQKGRPMRWSSSLERPACRVRMHLHHGELLGERQPLVAAIHRRGLKTGSLRKGSTRHAIGFQAGRAFDAAIRTHRCALRSEGAAAPSDINGKGPVPIPPSELFRCSLGWRRGLPFDPFVRGARQAAMPGNLRTEEMSPHVRSGALCGEAWAG